MEIKNHKTKIGITGQNGFIGSHLKNTLKYLYDCSEIIDFERDNFDDQKKNVGLCQRC